MAANQTSSTPEVARKPQQTSAFLVQCDSGRVVVDRVGDVDSNQMAVERLGDGRLIVGVYDFERDWWVARIDGSDRRAEGHWIHAVLVDLLDVPRGVVAPAWLIDAARRLPERETPLGMRVMCRCCGYLPLPRYGCYDICPVCDWEDDPTTISSQANKAVPVPITRA